MAGLELHEACSVGDFDTAEDIIASGRLDINMKDPEWKNKTPLHWACGKGYLDVIRLLLENGASGSSRMDMGWTPAHCAAEAGKLNVLRLLVTLGVPVHERDAYGDKPVRLAEMYGHRECVRYLQQVDEERQIKQLGTISEDQRDGEDAATNTSTNSSVDSDDEDQDVLNKKVQMKHNTDTASKRRMNIAR